MTELHSAIDHMSLDARANMIMDLHEGGNEMREQITALLALKDEQIIVVAELHVKLASTEDKHAKLLSAYVDALELNVELYGKLL